MINIYFLQMSISAGLLIIVIVIIRSVALNKLPKKTFLALWCIALLRLLIPVSIPVNLDINNSVGNTAVSFFSDNIENVISGIISEEEMQFAGDEQSLSLNPEIVMSEASEITVQKQNFTMSAVNFIWIIGACSAVIFFAAAYLKIHRELRYATLIRENDFLNEWLAKHKLMRSVVIMQSDKIKSPLTDGIINPRIVLPNSADMSDKQLLCYMLTHEYYHIRRFDSFWKLLLIVTVCLHWFNPMVWVMLILVNRDLELTCDEYVIHCFGAETKTRYAHMLVSIAESRSRFAPMYNGFSRNAIEERIESIMKIKKTSLIGVTVSVILIAVMTVSVAFSINASDNENPDLSEMILFGLPEESENEAEITDISDISDISEEESYYTYEEYIEFQENQKALWLSLINCTDENWMPIAGEPVLTQEAYDKSMSDWDTNPLLQETLQNIQNGLKIRKLPQHSYPYSVYDTLSPYLDLKCNVKNGKWILYNEYSTAINETFDTKDEMLERARWYLHLGALAGEVDMAQANTVYRGLYTADDN